MQNVRLKILPPWTTYINKIKALFDGDPQITIKTNYSSDFGVPSVTIVCNNGDKIAALSQILPDEVSFGNVNLEIYIDGIPSNRVFLNKKELFETAFSKNPVFAYAITPVEDGYNWFDITYIVFKNCVVQFFNDNLNDCHGIISTLYEDIARDIFTTDVVNNVFFNTDIERGSIGKPSGEWP